jgi:hypothetical protein
MSAIEFGGGGSARLIASAQDGAAFDGFGRMRVSEPYTIFDSKQLTGDWNFYAWSEAELSGSGTSSAYIQNRASTFLIVGSGIAGRRVRQTRRYFSYQPGKSHLINMTFVMGHGGNGIIKRAGYFDDNNGIYVEQSGTSIFLCRRSAVSGTIFDERVPQSNWNVDRLDGSTGSSINLDFTKSQILYIDMEWLGVGDVRAGFVINHTEYVAHQFKHSNILDAVYMSSPNLPLRYEIINQGAGASGNIEAICSTVISEGGIQEQGYIRHTDRENNALTTLNNNGIYPLIGMRLKSTHRMASVKMLDFHLLCTSTSNYRYLIIWNPTYIGGTPSWSGIPNSAIDVASTIPNTITCTIGSGILIKSGYAAQDAAVAVDDVGLETIILGSTASGVPDEIVLAVQRLSNQAETFYGGIGFREVI